MSMEKWRGCSENALENDKRCSTPILIIIISLLVLSITQGFDSPQLAALKKCRVNNIP